jgi:hypothetical protein
MGINEMKCFNKILVMAFLLVIILPGASYSEVDWEISSAIKLDEAPVDVAQAQGSFLTYILTDQANVLIYSADNELKGTIPVDPSVTDIAISSNGEKLFLINSNRKTLKTVDVSFIVDFNIDGSPFMGPSDAKVVVAVFSDFQ